MMSKLAIHGGFPEIKKSFKRYNYIGDEEKKAVINVLDSGCLSGFLASGGPEFFGGPKIQEFEQNWKDYFGCKHAVAVNSGTSGLYAAVGAIGVEPGDEVIVSPFTMTATATSILVYNGIPVFADIDERTFNITANTIKEKFTPRTKAIIVPHIFGQAAKMDTIIEFARRRNLMVIEDCAQAPSGKFNNKFVGKFGDIGVFSLNCHKHIHCGEGGVCITDNDVFADRLRLIRNHAEVVVAEKGIDDIRNMIGFNYRMTEIEAAIANEQLKKLAYLVEKRIEICTHLREELKEIEGIIIPFIEEGSDHLYYIFPILLDYSKLLCSREAFVKALCAEGLKAHNGYVTPLYLLPLYQRKMAFGRGYPFCLAENKLYYATGTCPVAERMHKSDLVILQAHQFDWDMEDVKGIRNAIEKVVSFQKELA